ncbi:hypothetical protein [Caldiplasma sukawensis]
MEKFILAILGVLLITGTVVAGGISPASTGTQMSLSTADVYGYNFQYNETSGYIANLSLVANGSSSGILVNSIYINGSNFSSGSISSLTYNLSFDNNAVLVLGSQYPDSVTFLTQSKLTATGSVAANMTLMLSEKAIKLTDNSNIYAKSTIVEAFKMTGLGIKVYAIQNSGYLGVIVTNGYVTTSNNGMTMKLKAPSISGIAQPLFVSFATNGNLEKRLSQILENKISEKFTYNNTTGNVTGKFVSFKFNSTDNVYSNIAVNTNNGSTEIINSMSMKGNGSLQNSAIINLPFNTPITVGSLFLYLNSSYIASIHDNRAIESSVLLSNGSFTITFPSGSNITIFQTHDTNITANGSLAVSNPGFQLKTEFGISGRFGVGKTAIKVSESNGRVILMSVGNGMVSENGETITVSTSGIAMINILSPPGLSHLGKYRGVFNYGLEHGKIATEIVVNTTYSNGSLEVQFNASVRETVSSENSGKVTIDVSATPGNHTGTNIAIFISNSVMKDNGNFTVTFDGSVATFTDFNGVVNVSSSTSAYFSFVKESGGVLFIIHIPHFSNHTITIQPSTATVTSSSNNNMYTYIILGVVVVVIVAVLVAMVVRRK